MRPSAWTADPDPLPRAAPVGPGSAYAAVATAQPVPVSVESYDGAVTAVRHERQLVDWLFSPDGTRPGHDAAAITVPHCWSRSEPELIDHKGPCWYARDVVLTPGRHHRLVFGALDYVAAVHVDDATPVWHEGGVTPVAVDLPAFASRCNVAVRVDDPVEPEMVPPHCIHANKIKAKGVQEFHDSRPGGGLFNEHWTDLWARRWGTGGMVAVPVLLTTGPARIEATFARATTTQVWLSWVVGNLSGADLDVELRASLTTPAGTVCGGVAVRATLPPHASRLSVTSPITDVTPWELGDGQCYTLATELSAGELSDATSVRFGAREAVLPLTPADQYQLSVNGRRSYVRAVNHIPGVWWPELGADLALRDVELAAGAHVNSWGPHALVLPDAWYDATDDAGMAVYQDFPLNLGHRPERPPLFDSGPDLATATLLLAAELAYHLYNHPSVVYYCGHNEPAYQLGEAFGGTNPQVVDMKRRFVEAPNEEALDAERVTVWQHVDPSRSAFAASGLGREREIGDVHTYTGSLTADPTTGIAGVERAFLSEFGAWTPDFSGAALDLPGTGSWPPALEDMWRWDEQTHFWTNSAIHCGRPDRFPDFPTWTFGSQLWAGAFTKLGIEAFRRRAWAPSGGHRYHLFLDHWGAAGAGVVDRHRTRQLSYWALRSAHTPLLPVAETLPSMRVAPETGIALRTWVVNDTPAAHDAVLRWSLRRLGDDEAWVIGPDDPEQDTPFGRPVPPTGDLVVLPCGEGVEVAAGEARVAVVADGASPGPLIEHAGLPAGTYAVQLNLDDGGERHRNWMAFVVADPAWEAAPGLSGVPRFALTLRHDGGYELRRRWTGESVAKGESVGTAVLTGLVPDQYLLRCGGDELALDLYGDVVVDVAAGTATGSPLPWPFEPLERA